MKRLVIFLMILALMGCSSKEERRDSLIANAKKLELADKCAEAKVEARNAIKLDPNAAEAHIVLGKCAMKEQNWRAAFGSFNTAYELAPDNLEAMEQLSRLYLMANEVERAKELADKLLAKNPSSVSYRVIRSGVYLREKQPEQAIRVLNSVLAEDPSNEEAVIGLTTAYLENGQLDKAEQVVSKAYAANSNSAILTNYMVNISILKKDYPQAIVHLEKLRTLQPDNENILLRIIDLYLVTDRTDEAMRVLEAEVKAQPNKSGLRSRLAELMYNAGKNEEGIAIINQAPSMDAQLYIAKSAGLVRINKAEEAIAELKKATTDPNAGPDMLRAKQRLAEIYVLSNKSEEAMKELNEIIQRNPGDNRATALRGRINYLRGNYTDAVSDLRSVMRDNPKDSASALALAESERLLGNARVAEETLRASIAATPEYLPAYIVLAGLQRNQGNTAQALETIKKGAADTDMPELHFAYIDSLVGAERYREAESYANKLVNGKKDLAIPGYIRLAAMNAQQKKFREARDYYSKALEVNPDHYQAAEGYVLMEVAQGRTSQALRWVQNRAKVRPEDPNTMALLAEVYNESKNYNAAISSFKDASKLAPQWDQPYVRIMQVYNVELKKPQEAVKFLQESWKANPDVVTPAIILASYHESTKNYAEAEKIYREVMAKSPDLLAVNNNLAYILTLHNPTPERLNEALAMAQKGASANTPETLDTLGWVYYKLNKLPEALENLNKSYEGGGSESPVISYHLAVVHEAMGNKAEAKKLLTEILAKSGNFDGRAEAEALLKRL